MKLTIPMLGSVWFFVAIVFLGCGGMVTTATAATAVDTATFPLPKTPVAGPKASGSINGATSILGDGFLTLPGVASVAFSADSLPAYQPITLRATSDANTAALFDVQRSLYQLTMRLPYEIRINTGSIAPSSMGASVTLNLPASFFASVPAGTSFIVFGQETIGADDETAVEFKPLESVRNTVTEIISLTLPGNAFTNATFDGSYEAVLIIAAGPVLYNNTNLVAPPNPTKEAEAGRRHTKKCGFTGDKSQEECGKIH